MPVPGRGHERNDGEIARVGLTRGREGRTAPSGHGVCNDRYRRRGFIVLDVSSWRDGNGGENGCAAFVLFSACVSFVVSVFLFASGVGRGVRGRQPHTDI